MNRGEQRDAWIACALSLALPGTGQLWRGHVSGAFWMLLGALLIAAWALADENLGVRSLWLRSLSFLLLGVLSGWHAWKCTRRDALS